MNRFISFLLIAVLSYSAAAQQLDWYWKIKELTFLTSDLKDVIRVYDLGPKTEKSLNDDQRYHLAIRQKEGQTELEFARAGRCSRQFGRIGSGWNVDEWALVLVVFTPDAKKPTHLGDLPFSISDSWKTERSENRIFYSDLTDGIFVDTDADNKINTVGFRAPSSMLYLTCPNPMHDFL